MHKWLPFYRSLDASFFVRVVFFSLVCCFAFGFASKSEERKQLVQIDTGDDEERGGGKLQTISMGADYRTKFSRTLGREKVLDEILAQVDSS